MADLTITSGNVTEVSSTVGQEGTAGQVILAGSACYYDSTASVWYIASSLSAALSGAGTDSLIGIAANSALGTGQKFRVITEGNIGFGSILTIGVVYCVSSNAGRICPDADVTTGLYKTTFGQAVATSTLSSWPGGFFPGGVPKS